MDSPNLLHLGFLLLALAASHPNIAMSTVGLTEGTQHSSSGNTTVTVYHCKDCKSSACKPRANSFEKFEKIAETRNKASSDETIKLVTNETHVTVCFEQANSYIEGIYAVFWEKAWGAGVSCGILNSGENVRDNNSTEKSICCEAETDIWRHNPTLKCYTQKSHPKPIILPVRSPEGILGDPELVTSKNNSIGLVFAFVVFLVGTGGTIIYCLWRRHHHQDFKHDRLFRENSTPI